MKVRSHSVSPSIARGIAALCAAVLVAMVPSIARAAGVVGTGTVASCTDAALNAALAGGGLVTFNCGPAPLTIDISTGTGTKTIAADTTIDGGGIITISGGNPPSGNHPVFDIPAGLNVTIENLTIANGRQRSGGGISNSGMLTVINCIFRGNVASHDGGAISNSGTLSVINSTFTGNTANESNEGEGGGIFNDGSGSLTVVNSTFTGNTAIGPPGDALNFDSGGGISNSGTLTVTNSTFAGNSRMSDSINNNRGGTAVLRNSIVANGAVCYGSITDGGHNLDDGTSCGFSTANGSLSNTDPQLDPAGLQNNGGPTQTVALCTGVGVPAGCTAASPAIDAGDPSGCAAAPVNNLDQRGFARPGTGHTACSIGAYEADATAPEACIGDCSGTHTVAINDLITLVNIALGTAQPSACADGVPVGADVTVAVIIQAVNNALNGCSDPSASAAEAVVVAAMRKYQVPGVAMALVEGGQVVWSRGYGMANKEAHIPVDASTVFQVGSLSKAVAAWGALKVAESGALDLGMPIGTYLHRWQIPAWTSFDPKGVTGYRILSHTAGLSVHGYDGYLPGTTLPTLEQSLSGATGYPVYIAQAPGMGFLYSGGGYTVMQLAIEETAGQTFASYLRTNILLPLGMTSSAFEWLSELQARTAVGYSASGQRQPNYLYTELAAAGLYTTAADYARFVAAGVVKGDQPLGRGVLAPSTVELSQTSAPASAGAEPGIADGLSDPDTTYGLGVFITKLSNGPRLVYHRGTNIGGWRCEWAALPDSGQGIVVLTNSDNGRPLASDVICDWIPRAGGGTASSCP